MDRFHKIHVFERQATWRIHMVPGETDEETSNLKTRQCVAGDLEAYVRCVETQRKTKNGLSRNQSSTTPEDCVVSSSLNLMMRNSRTWWKNARRKLEIPMPAAMPCKTPVNSSGETYRGIGKSKTKYACIVEADESTRIRLEGVPCRYHEDHIAANTKSLQFCTQICSNVPSRRMKRPQFMSKNWICSWQWKSSRIRQQFYR